MTVLLWRSQECGYSAVWPSTLECPKHNFGRRAGAKPASFVRRTMEAYHEGNELFVDGEVEAAVGCYTRAIEADGSKGQFWSKRAAALLKLKKPAEALSDAAKAVELSPEREDGYLQKGSVTRFRASRAPSRSLTRHRTALFELDELESANAAFQAGLRLAQASSSRLVAKFKTWIRKCEAEIEGARRCWRGRERGGAADAASVRSQTRATRRKRRRRETPRALYPHPPKPLRHPLPRPRRPWRTASGGRRRRASCCATAHRRDPRLRYDWYQSATHVTVSIMAKKVKKEESSVVVSADKVGAAVVESQRFRSRVLAVGRPLPAARWKRVHSVARVVR